MAGRIGSWDSRSRRLTIGPQVVSRTMSAARATRLQADHQATMKCMDNREFMRGLADDSMKLIVTSPPYNIGKSYERRSTLDKYVSDQAQVISECVRLLHPEGSICWQVGNHVLDGEVFPLDIVL